MKNKESTSVGWSLYAVGYFLAFGMLLQEYLVLAQNAVQVIWSVFGALILSLMSWIMVGVSIIEHFEKIIECLG